MKRTGEVVLGIIGALIYGFLSLVMMGIFFLQTADGEALIREEFQRQQTEMPGVTADMNVDGMLEAIQSIPAMLIFAVFSIAIVLGIIAMVVLRGNKKPKLAGWLLIGASVVSIIVTQGVAIFAGIFYLIAGIMCLARKPQEIIEE
ncbi:hypothetical protein AB990_09300 [Alkalihalobacillus pseudalcaliphilus]|nr:hypothetical protein AB990_09300 [Alkalihalobacillus pseudalcaliphilus]